MARLVFPPSLPQRAPLFASYVHNTLKNSYLSVTQDWSQKPGVKTTTSKHKMTKTETARATAPEVTSAVENLRHRNTTEKCE